MRAVYTHYERGGVWAHKDFMLGGGSARKPQTHTMARRVLTEHGATTHTGHTSQRGYTWAHREGAAGGGGGLGAGHPNTTHMAIYSLHTRNSTQHYLTEGWEGGKGSKPRWKHSSKETESSAVVNTHTPARKHATHQVRDSPEGGEGCGCGLWGHGTSAVLGRSHYRHHRATRMGREGMRPTDQTPAMWKEVPHNRVSNRVV